MFEKIRKMKNQKGFTLVELIVVLVILAILAALLVPAHRADRKICAVYPEPSICRITIQRKKVVFGRFSAMGAQPRGNLPPEYSLNGYQSTPICQYQIFFAKMRKGSCKMWDIRVIL